MKSIPFSRNYPKVGLKLNICPQNVFSVKYVKHILGVYKNGHANWFICIICQIAQFQATEKGDLANSGNPNVRLE